MPGSHAHEPPSPARFPRIAAILLLAPPAFAARGFSLGVTAGEVTAKSAILWGKANKSGSYTLEIARNKALHQRPRRATSVRAQKSDDNTVQKRVRGLQPGHALLVPLQPRARCAATSAPS